MFPNKDKYTLGRKINNLIIEIIELVFLAVNSKENYKILKKISIKIDLLKMLIRLAKETKVIDNKKYVLLQKELQEIGRMTGGWIKKAVK